jgi:MoaA/NifB/PqqE/SkfB family radical SAM enzyme
LGTKYSNKKIFHFQDKLDSLPEETGEILAPIHVRIKPTNYCNHKCSYCAYRDTNLHVFGKDDVVRTMIPKQKMMEIIDDIVDMGIKAVTFSGGGEPFMYSHMTETVQRLAESPVKFASLTNGSLVKGDVAEIFARHGSWLRVSMDGWDDESYTRYRGVKIGEFSKVMTNLKRFKQYNGPCYLGVSYIIDHRNAEHVYDFLSKIKDVGVNSVKMSACLVSDKQNDNNNYHQPFFKTVSQQIDKAVATLQDSEFEIFNAYQDSNEKFKKTYNWCPYIQILPIIGADLNIYTCPDKAYNFEHGRVGSIKDRSFKEFWFDGKEKFFKTNPSIHCNHHCETNPKNIMIHNYLDADVDHLEFV